LGGNWVCGRRGRAKEAKNLLTGNAKASRRGEGNSYLKRGESRVGLKSARERREGRGGRRKQAFAVESKGVPSCVELSTLKGLGTSRRKEV